MSQIQKAVVVLCVQPALETERVEPVVRQEPRQRVGWLDDVMWQRGMTLNTVLPGSFKQADKVPVLEIARARAVLVCGRLVRYCAIQQLSAVVIKEDCGTSSVSIR